MEIKFCDCCGGHTGVALHVKMDKIVEKITHVYGLDLCPGCEKDFCKERENALKTVADKFNQYFVKVAGRGAVF